MSEFSFSEDSNTVEAQTSEPVTGNAFEAAQQAGGAIANVQRGGEIAQTGEDGVQLVGQRAGVGQIVYSQYMDVPSELNIDVQGSISNSETKLSDVQADQQLTAIYATTNYYRVQEATSNLATQMINTATAQQKTAAATYNYSKAVSQKEIARTDAEYYAQTAKNNQEVRQHQLTTQTGAKMKWQEKAKKARQTINQINNHRSSTGEAEVVGGYVETGRGNNDNVPEVEILE